MASKSLDGAAILTGNYVSILANPAEKLFMKELLTSFLNQIGHAYWVEITTQTPACIYYFGPFLTVQEAEAEQDGYREDLVEEGAEGIRITIKRCRPQTLTIAEDWGDDDRDLMPS